MSQVTPHKFTNYLQTNLIGNVSSSDIGNINCNNIQISNLDSYLFFNVKSSSLIGNVKFEIEGYDASGGTYIELIEIVPGVDEYYSVNVYNVLSKIHAIGGGSCTVNYINFERDISQTLAPGNIRTVQGAVEFAQVIGDGSFTLGATAQPFDPYGAPNQMLRFLASSTTTHDIQLEIKYKDSSGSLMTETVILDIPNQTEYYFVPTTTTSQILSVTSLADGNQTVSCERYDLIQDTAGQYNLRQFSLIDFNLQNQIKANNSGAQLFALKDAFSIHSFAISTINPLANGTSAIVSKNSGDNSVHNINSMNYVSANGATGTIAGIQVKYGTPTVNWWQDSIIAGEFLLGSIDVIHGPEEGTLYLTIAEVIGSTPTQGNVGRWIHRISTGDFAMIMQETYSNFNCAQWIHIDNNTKFYDFVKHYIYESGLAVNISKQIVENDSDYEITDLN